MKDYIIVGLGLAGMTVAEELNRRGKSFLLFDDDSENASAIAGGVINPLVLKWYTKTWKAEEFIPSAKAFYKKLDCFFKTNFFKDISIYRKLSSIKEQNDWVVATDKPYLKSFMDSDLKSLEGIPAEFDFGLVRQTALLHTDHLLKTYADFLGEQKKLIRESFSHRNLEIEGGFVRYKNFKARKIIFCEGVGILRNPFFKNLPLRGNKGEYLLIKAPGLKLNAIVKSSIFLIPQGEDYYKVGATYEREFENKIPEKETGLILRKKLETLIDRPYEIVAQMAGVRPTVKDRRPLLGRHPQHKNLFVCNGFGSRGVMIAPTAAKWLIAYTEKKKALPQEVDIARFA